MNQPLSENTQPTEAVSLTDTQRFWFAHVEQCLASGLSIAAYARQHQLADKSLYHWIKRKREWPSRAVQAGAGTATFHPVQIAPPVSSRLPERPALWLRLANGIECQFYAIDTEHCLTLLTGLSRLPA